MELRQVEFFLAVVQAGTFLRAAEQLNMPQPSLWRQVKMLEKDLGIALFERAGRGVVLTSAGAQLLPRAEQLLAQADGVRTLAVELARGRAGVVTVSCAHPHVPRFIAPLLGSFHEAHPGIEVTLRESPGLPPVEHVLSGEADFITSLPRAEGGLSGARLGDIGLVVVTADDHPWRHRAEVTVAELAGQRVLVGVPRSLTRRLLEPAVRGAGIALDIALESANPSTQFALARAGLGVAVLAEDALSMTVPDASASWPRLADERYPMSAPVWLYWAAGRDLGPAGRLFADHVKRASKTLSS